jgi:hypothetical protein
MSRSETERFVFVSDSHGDLIDPSAEEATLSFIRDFSPTIVGHGGDAFDFRCLRRGIAADDEDGVEGLRDDIDCGISFLSKIYRLKSIRERFFLLGNHEHRLIKTARSNPRGFIREAASGILENLESKIKGFGVRKLTPYHSRLGVYSFGAINAVHGYSTGLNAVRLHAATYARGKCRVVLMGHIHRDEHSPAPSGEDAEGYSSGTLANFEDDGSMDYASGRIATLAWRQSFLAGFINRRTGATMIFSIRKFGKTWIIPGSFNEMKESSRSR